MEELFREHGQALFAYIAWSCGDSVVAEDLLADVFERALRHRGRFDRRRGTERTWLYAIAVNVVRDAGRSRAAEGRAMERLHVNAALARSTVDSSAAVEVRDELASALRRLSDEEREVVALRFGADLTLEQIAKATGEPKTTVEGRLYRALRRLRTVIDGA